MDILKNEELKAAISDIIYEAGNHIEDTVIIAKIKHRGKSLQVHLTVTEEEDNFIDWDEVPHLKTRDGDLIEDNGN